MCTGAHAAARARLLHGLASSPGEDDGPVHRKIDLVQGGPQAPQLLGQGVQARMEPRRGADDAVVSETSAEPLKMNDSLPQDVGHVRELLHGIEVRPPWAFRRRGVERCGQATVLANAALLELRPNGGQHRRQLLCHLLGILEALPGLRRGVGTLAAEQAHAGRRGEEGREQRAATRPPDTPHVLLNLGDDAVGEGMAFAGQRLPERHHLHRRQVVCLPEGSWSQQQVGEDIGDQIAAQRQHPLHQLRARAVAL
mmetsp:Transcript_75165/g.218238  ORF Transcript_75165/g.218238 Transcript_75165/m.218238 type:complete len:254 (+) Transcript_75165:663-1424(+)